MNNRTRKNIRLSGFDYSKNGSYFVTICTQNREILFKNPSCVGADSISARNAGTDYMPSQCVGADSISVRNNGIINDRYYIAYKMIDGIFNKTIQEYDNVFCPKYVIMPNHIHAIITINRTNYESHMDIKSRADIESGADMESAPTTTVSLPQIIQAFKRHSTIEYIKLVKNNILPPFNKRIWQRSYYDRIIRNEDEYRRIWIYIDQNPLKWREDSLFAD